MNVTKNKSLLLRGTLFTRIHYLSVDNILDDEFIIELDDSPPFSWIRQSPNRFMTCTLKETVDSVTVHSTGNALQISKMVRDLVGSAKLRADDSFTSMGEGTNVIISYSGELRKAIALVKESTGRGIVMSSGGTIKNIARDKAWDYIPLPKGYPTRFIFPEIFGCLLSLLGKKIECPALEDFIDSIMPSSITEDNLSKQIAYRLAKEEKVILLHDEQSAGLAGRFRDDFEINAGINVDLRNISKIGLPGTEVAPEKYVFSLTKKAGNLEEGRVSSLPFDSSSMEGYIENALIAEMSSLYLGFLKKREIEFLDRDTE